MRGPNNDEQPKFRNIVSFGKYHSQMTQPVLSQIRSYWEELRAGRLMPLRSEVDPREMSPFLESCFVLERVPSGDVRFRLAGMGIGDLMGMEVRGMPLRALISPADRPLFSAKLANVFETPEIQEYKLQSDQPNSPDLSAVLLILPLKGDDGVVSRAIGCLTTSGSIGVAPRRFRVKDLQRTSLLTGLTEGNAFVMPDRPVDPRPHATAHAEPAMQSPTKAPAKAPVNGFAETGKPFKHRPKAHGAPQNVAQKKASAKAHASYLRVIK